MEKKLWHNYGKKILLFIIGLIIFLGVFLFICSLFFIFIYYHRFSFALLWMSIIEDKQYYVFYVLLIGFLFYLIVIGYFYFIKKNEKNFISQTKNKTYGSAAWANKWEIKKNYPEINIFELHNRLGVVVNSYQLKNKKIFANVCSDTHAIIIAGTRSGKTQGIILPTMFAFAYSAVKPSILVADPKGEIFNTTSLLFSQKGYNIIRLDLRNLLYSHSWNPLTIVYDSWYESYVLKLTNKNKSEIMRQKAFEYLSDLCQVFFPIENAKDTFWQESAAGVLKGILISILTNMEENNQFDKKKFNLPEVIAIVNNLNKFVQYLKTLDDTHPAKIAAASIIDGAKETTNSIVQTIKTGLEKFSDPALRSILLNNDFNFQSIINTPTVIYLIVPDERTDRHIFASLFISQLYKILIELVDAEHQKLLRPFYFMLDEFGNIPSIPDISSKITVSGSRNIWWVLVIQDRSQLINKYNQYVAQTILNNCSLHIFLQTMDFETAKYYSDMIGNKTIISKSFSWANTNIRKNYSEVIKEAKLITPGDLKNLPAEMGVVLCSRKKPFKANFFPLWKYTNIVKAAIPSAEKNIINDLEFKNDYFYQLKIVTSIDKNNADVTLQKINKNFNEFCDNCHVKLLKKNGKFGEFYGCPNFPHCKFTRNL